jgi:hypothetical protein
MALMVIHHKVRDYAVWRPAYDAHESNRVGAGITNGRVYRKAEDPNDLVILLDVADVAKARVWASCRERKENYAEPTTSKSATIKQGDHCLGIVRRSA